MHSDMHPVYVLYFMYFDTSLENSLTPHDMKRPISNVSN